MTPFSQPLTEPWKDSYWRRLFLWVVLLTLVWSFLWFWPWQVELQEFIWLRLGIALIIFLVPGLAMYGLLTDRQGRWTDQLAFGFVISHLLIASAGAIGRLIHVSFGLIKDLMMLLGLLLLLLYLLPIVSKGMSFQINRSGLGRMASAWPLILISVLVSLIVIQRVLSNDDLTYLAYITNLQHAVHLDFKDLVLGADRLVHPRFWLISVPFAQAFLAEISGLPGILVLGGYYEPFLVLLSILCWYGLARSLDLSHQAASISVILQALSLLLLSQYVHPGAPFFNQLSVDKATAAFILAPAFIQSEIWLLRKPTKNNIFLCLLTGLSLTFMHPIALAYSVFIGGLILILNLNRSNFRTAFIVVSILLAMLIPQVALRFVQTEAEGNIAYGVEEIQDPESFNNIISVWQDTPFYGFSPNILTMTFPYESRIPFFVSFLKWAWLFIPICATIFAIGQLRQNNLAQYIFSSFLLCTIAGFPLTGWMIGYFLSPWMLERATWLFPYGLSAVFFLIAVRDKTVAGRYINTLIQKLQSKIGPSGWPLATITVLSSALILLFMREQGLPNFALFESKSQRYQDLARTGKFLDRHIPGKAVAIGSDDLNDLIPGISSKAKIMTFRTSNPANMPYYSLEIINERISAKRMILSRRESSDTRLHLLKKYNVRFLLLRRSDYALFKNLVSSHPALFEITEIGRYIIIEVRQTDLAGFNV